MVSYPNCRRIVRTLPGRGTNESIYETEDGRFWYQRTQKSTGTTGETIGYLCNGFICPRQERDDG